MTSGEEEAQSALGVCREGAVGAAGGRDSLRAPGSARGVCAGECAEASVDERSRPRMQLLQQHRRTPGDLTSRGRSVVNRWTGPAGDEQPIEGCPAAEADR